MKGFKWFLNFFTDSSFFLLRTLLYGSNCINCNEPLHLKYKPDAVSDSAQQFFCKKCREVFFNAQQSGEVCPLCGRPTADSGISCCYCNSQEYFFESNSVVFQFNVLVEKLIKNYKYRGCRRTTDFFAFSLAKKLSERFIIKDIVMCPSNPKNTRRRGFDHSKQISNSLPDFKIYQVLGRNPGKSQKELNAEQRFDNLTGKIFIKEPFKSSPKMIPEEIILIDDVFTTGSTLNACSKLLKEYGVKKIYCCTLTAKITGIL